MQRLCSNPLIPVLPAHSWRSQLFALTWSSPIATCPMPLRLCPVLTELRAQCVYHLAERGSHAQRLSHRRQEVAPGTGYLRHLLQGPLHGRPVLTRLVRPYSLDLPAECILRNRVLNESVLDGDDRTTARLYLA